MLIGLVQPGTSRGTLRQMIGSRNITPPRMLRMVPFGDFHISFKPNSFTRAFLEQRVSGRIRVMHPRYSTANAKAKAKALCTLSPSFRLAPQWFTTLRNGALGRRLRGGARHHIPGYEDTADQRPRQARAGAPPGKGRDDGRDP